METKLGKQGATGVLSGEKGWYFRKSGSGVVPEERLNKDLKEKEWAAWLPEESARAKTPVGMFYAAQEQ